MSRKIPHHVVPANAGTHTPQPISWQAAGRLSLDHKRRWLWIPAFAGTKLESIAKLGQWPTWKTISKEIRPFTIN
jgi:hypothetical protein